MADVGTAVGWISVSSLLHRSFCLLTVGDDLAQLADQHSWRWVLKRKSLSRSVLHWKPESNCEHRQELYAASVEDTSPILKRSSGSSTDK